MASDRDPSWRLRGFARTKRHNHTDAEGLLWSMLRNRKLAGMKFRRQVPIEGFIVDFYCMETKLAIELDGSQHGDAAAYDAWRSRLLALHGIRVLCFSNEDVLKDVRVVLRTVLELSKQYPHPTLSRSTGRGTS
jgi:adenine-specific DNA-methyltransferase